MPFLIFKLLVSDHSPPGGLLYKNVGMLVENLKEIQKVHARLALLV